MQKLAITSRLNAVSDILYPHLYEAYENWFASFGGGVTKTDMREYAAIQPIYAQANLFGTFDGATVYLHENPEEVGGLHYTTLDLMHLGMHCIQMSMPAEVAATMGLKFDKERSRKEIYDGEVNPKTLPDLIAYEAEAHSLTLGWINFVLPSMTEQLAEHGITAHQFQDLMHDVYAADLAYVEYVLTTNELPSFSGYLEKLDDDDAERARFSRIREMLRPVDVNKTQDFKLEKLPNGGQIFGIRGENSYSTPKPKGVGLT